MKKQKKYPDTVNLPFNAKTLNGGFVPVKPGDECEERGGFWIILQGDSMLLSRDGDEIALYEGAFPQWAAADSMHLQIGRWLGKPLHALRIDDEGEVPDSFAHEPFNAYNDHIDDRLLTLAGLARQIIHWEDASAFCSICGDAMLRITGSWGKRCGGCRKDHFPPIHPCIIVLVRRGDNFLLARKAEWAEGRYSLIAGFLEFGESLEECVEREVKEETGIDVKNIRYVGSQNWPFPSQLMAGFVADYAGGEIVVDRDELEDARWFSLESMPESLPSRRSIARWIIDRFALGRS